MSRGSRQILLFWPKRQKVNDKYGTNSTDKSNNEKKCLNYLAITFPVDEEAIFIHLNQTT